MRYYKGVAWFVTAALPTTGISQKRPDCILEKAGPYSSLSGTNAIYEIMVQLLPLFIVFAFVSCID